MLLPVSGIQFVLVIEHIVLVLIMLSVTARIIVPITYLKQKKDVCTGHLSCFGDGELGSLVEFPPCGKTSPLPLCDAGSIIRHILSEKGGSRCPLATEYSGSITKLSGGSPMAEGEMGKVCPLAWMRTGAPVLVADVHI